MTTMRQHRSGLTLLFGASGIFVIACIFLADSIHDSARASRSDPWRRTAQGWERASTWRDKTSAASESPTAKRRWDTHPAALILAQITVIAFGYYALPKFPGRMHQESWRTQLARSFRASMFG